MREEYKISESELEVMKVVWKKGKATSSEIVKELEPKTSWKPKTIQTLITRLVGKGILEANKSDSKAYTYIAKVSEEEYKDFANESFIKKLYNGSVNLMISTFIKEKRMSKDDIEELKQILDKEI